MSPPILVAGHDEGLEPHDEGLEPESEAVVDEPELEGWVEQAEMELVLVEGTKKQWEGPMSQRVGEPIRLGVMVALGDENGVKDAGNRKQEGQYKHDQSRPSAIMCLEEAVEQWQEEGLD